MAKINPYYMQIGQADREKEELEKKRKKNKTKYCKKRTRL